MSFIPRDKALCSNSWWVSLNHPCCVVAKHCKLRKTKLIRDTPLDEKVKGKKREKRVPRSVKQLAALFDR